MALGASIIIAASARALGPGRPESASSQKSLAILAMLTPKRDLSVVPLGDHILRTAKRVLEGRPGIRALALEELELSSDTLATCPAAERLRCWAHAFEAQGPDYIIVIALYPRSEGIEWLSTVALDVKIAKAIEARHPPDRDDTRARDALEDAIFAQATRVRSISLTSADDTELERLIRSLLPEP